MICAATSAPSMPGDSRSLLGVRACAFVIGFDGEHPPHDRDEPRGWTRLRHERVAAGLVRCETRGAFGVRGECDDLRSTPDLTQAASDLESIAVRKIAIEHDGIGRNRSERVAGGLEASGCVGLASPRDRSPDG